MLKKSLTRRLVEIDGQPMPVAEASKLYAKDGLSRNTIESRLYAVTQCTSSWLTRKPIHGQISVPNEQWNGKMCTIDGEKMTIAEAKTKYAGNGLQRATIGDRLRRRSNCSSEWLTRPKTLLDGAIRINAGENPGVWLNGRPTNIKEAARRISILSKFRKIRVEQNGSFINAVRDDKAKPIADAQQAATLAQFVIVHQADAGTVLELLT
jgi:hypothetical protein